MHMNITRLRNALVALTLMGISMQVCAEEEQTGPWSGKVGLGYLAASGNTESTTFTGNFEVNRDGERWHHQLLGKAFGKTDDKVTTAEAYKAAYEFKFDLVKRIYLFGLLDYNKDRFSGYEQQTYEVIGVGNRFIKTDRQEFDAEFGIGASQLTPAGESRINEATYRISGDYKLIISENSTFSQKLSASFGSSNTYTESLTELNANIIGALALVLGYSVRHNSDVVPGKEKTDTLASISLEYVF